MDEEGMQKTANGLINIANPIELDEEYLWGKLETSCFYTILVSVLVGSEKEHKTMLKYA